MSAPAHSASKRRYPDADDGDGGAPAGRRVFPRHFHHGPNPIADGAADAAADADAATPVVRVDGAAAHGAGAGAAVADADPTRPRPSAAQLYRHALESIFAFLSLREAAAALRVSKDWAAAVQSAPGLQRSFDCNPHESLPFVAMACSAMGRHVTSLNSTDEPLELSEEALFLLARHMAHLRALHCRSRELGASGPVFFPAALRVLHLDLRDADTERVNTALSAIGRLAQLETLEIAMHKIHRQVSFGPLAALRLLRSLTITEQHKTQLTDAQVDELRALPRLQEIHISSVSTALLRRLLAQPHDLQWKQISLPSSLTDDDAALLQQLPSLTKLSLSAEHLTGFDFLHRLPNLESLDCTTNDGSDGLLDLLVAGLGLCTGVTDLQLDRCLRLTSAHLAELLPRLPRLQSLSLSDLRIDSLSFLAQTPMTDQLSKLRLQDCQFLFLTQLRHVHSLRGLRELRIDRSFNEPMDPDCELLMALDPPSAVLPLLESFIYVGLGESAPDHDSGESEDEPEDAHAAAVAAAVDDGDAGQNEPGGAAPDGADYDDGWGMIIF